MGSASAGPEVERENVNVLRNGLQGSSLYSQYSQPGAGTGHCSERPGVVESGGDIGGADCDEGCDQSSSVLDIRRKSVSGQWRDDCFSDQILRRENHLAHRWR